jgi:hypothetical protein
MPSLFQKKVKVPLPAVIWLLGFVAVALLGGSLVIDLGGQSNADNFVLARWSFEGLRVYLWLESGLLIAVTVALGIHVLSIGFAVARGHAARLFGMPSPLHPVIAGPAGYIFVVLGAALVAMSLSMFVLLNSCRYMRLV